MKEGSTRGAAAQFGVGIATAIEAAPDITLREIGERLAAARGVEVGKSTLSRFLISLGFSFKKTAHAAEQEREDVALGDRQSRRVQIEKRARRDRRRRRIY